MIRNDWKRILQLLLVCFSTAIAAASQDLSQPEQEKAQHYLEETRAGVLDAVKGLSEAQLKFKPAPDRWSIAEVVEHLALTEELVENILGKIEQAPAGAHERDLKKIDAIILASVPDRTRKFQAPPSISPTGRWTPAEAIEHFQAARKQIADVLSSTPDLRKHVVDHPALGPLDGYQWVLTTAAHSARHTKQILEVKTDPHFPEE